MINSKICKDYFPVLSHITSFNEDEKRALCKWARVFRTEVLVREREKSEQGFLARSYNLSKYDEGTMIDMIEKNCFDDQYLAILNAIIYRHKYNAFLSTWFFPVLTKTLINKYFMIVKN